MHPKRHISTDGITGQNDEAYADSVDLVDTGPKLVIDHSKRAIFQHHQTAQVDTDGFSKAQTYEDVEDSYLGW